MKVSMILAVAGKGGTGKTTLAALMVRALKEEHAGSILAIDADPNSNLGELLGFKNVSTIVEIIDDISKNPDQIPPGVTKDRYIDLRVQETIDEGDGFDLLTMGRPEGPGCYCFANNMLRGLITKLMKSYDFIVIDNEAGMEHLSRRLAREVDILFIVSDSTAIGIRSAARISHLADSLEIKVKEKLLILNKSKGEDDKLKKETENAGLDRPVVLPFDTAIEENAISNKSVFELEDKHPVLEGVKGLVIAQHKH